MRILLFFLCFFLVQRTSAQKILEQYLQDAIQTNLALQQKIFSYQKSINALKEARRMFLPEITFESRFTAASGGRIDEYPIGDIINPIHRSLNELDPQNDFDTDVDPLAIRFFRPTEQENKLQLVQPLFQAELHLNKKIQRDMMHIRESEVKAYQRELVAEVKQAYYNYLIAVEALKIFDQAEKQLEANLKTSQSLVRYGKATNNVTYRIEAEVSSLQAERASAEKGLYLAAAYFNFLLNKPFSSEIEVDSGFARTSAAEIVLEQEREKAMQDREELQQLRFSKNISQKSISLNRSSSLPGLFAVIDYGIQGVDYNIHPDDDFFFGSIILRWNLSSFYRKSPRVKQAKFELATFDVKLKEVQNQVGLQVSEAYFDLVEAEKKIIAAEAKLVSAQKNYDIVQKQFGQSTISHIDMLDAQTIFFESRIQAIIANYNYLIKQAVYEKVTASFDFSTLEQ